MGLYVNSVVIASIASILFKKFFLMFRCWTCILGEDTYKSLCQGKYYPSFLALSASLPSRYLVIRNFALILLNFRHVFGNRSLPASGRAWSFWAHVALLNPFFCHEWLIVQDCACFLDGLLPFLFDHLRRPRFGLVSRKCPKSARELEKSTDFHEARFQFRFPNHSTKKHL